MIPITKFFSVLILLTTTSIAHADSFIIDKGGKEYLCTETSQNSGSAASCASKAYSGPFSRDESIQLCQGAYSDAPADCAIKAYSGPFSRTEAIQICQKATTLGPAECAIKAYSGPFSRVEAAELCSGDGSIANAECAIKAYSGPYSRAEAIQLCKNNPRLLIRTLDLLEEQELNSKSEK